MTTELAMPNETWFALKEAKGGLPKPFERKVDLGSYEVRGLVHLDNPALQFRKLGSDGKLSLRIGTDGACELVKGEIVFGWLPAREGAVFNRLLKGGKRLVGVPVEMSVDGLEPTMEVNIVMEEF